MDKEIEDSEDYIASLRDAVRMLEQELEECHMVERWHIVNAIHSGKKRLALHDNKKASKIRDSSSR